MASKLTPLEELRRQQAQIQAQIEEATRAESGEALQKVKELVSQFGLTAEQIFSSGSQARTQTKPKGKVGRPPKASYAAAAAPSPAPAPAVSRAPAAKKVVKKEKAPVLPKYRDPDTGATWSGRGKTPRWIAGKDRAKFEIKH